MLEHGGRRTLRGALIAGVTATKFGLHATALVYSASVAVLVVAATGVLLVRRSAVSRS